MISRFIIGIIGVPVLIYIYLTGGIPLLVFTNFVIIISLKEYFDMIKKSGKKAHEGIGLVAGIVIPNVIYYYLHIDNSFMINEFTVLIFSILLMLVYRVFKNRVENASSEIGRTVFGLIYIAMFFSYLLKISALKSGGQYLLLIQALVWVCDSLAYFTGISIGRKFFKNGFSEISPKKSVEGAIGGTVFTVLIFALVTKFFMYKGYNIAYLNHDLYKMMFLVFILTLIIQIGDLAESMFKREFKIKDSGKILMEHGGILDRFDSMIFVLPFSYYLLVTVL